MKTANITLSYCHNEKDMHDHCFYLVQCGARILQADIDPEIQEGYVLASIENPRAFEKAYKKTSSYQAAIINYVE
jgi:hypothetical protein